MNTFNSKNGYGRRGFLISMSSAALSTVIPVSAFAQIAAPEKQFLSIGSSSVGGSWFSLGGVFANLISKKIPELRATAEATGGSIDNINLIKNNNVELGFTTNAEAYEAIHGIGAFEEKVDDFSAIMGGGGIYWQLYTLKKNGINSIRDLKNKRVSLGAPGSIGNKVGQVVIEAHGLEMVTDWQPEYLSHSDGPDALRDGSVDAVLIISTMPTSALVDLSSSEGENVVFLNPEPEVLADLKKEYPYWMEASIPGDIYKGHPNETPGSFGFSTVLIAANSLSTEAVYAIAKTLCESSDEIAKAHAAGKDWVCENALKGIEGVLPLHPGSEAYFKERGLL